MSIDFGLGCRLDPVTEDSLGLLKKMRNEFAIRRWCRQNDLLSDLDQVKWYQKINTDPTCKMYSVSVNEMLDVGVVGLTGIDQYNQKAEFSIYINPEKHLNGFGEMALRTLVCHGFGNLNLNRIFGETFSGNPGAKLYDKLGFKFEGILRQSYFKSGQWIDSEYWSILRKDIAALPWIRLTEV